jgi:hypothetical protein
MIWYILFLLVLLFLFVCVLLYKMTNLNWAHQLITRNFTDKDLFTRIVKFLIK